MFSYPKNACKLYNNKIIHNINTLIEQSLHEKDVSEARKKKLRPEVASWKIRRNQALITTPRSASHPYLFMSWSDCLAMHLLLSFHHRGWWTVCHHVHFLPSVELCYPKGTYRLTFCKFGYWLVLFVLSWRLICSRFQTCLSRKRTHAAQDDQAWKTVPSVEQGRLVVKFWPNRWGRVRVFLPHSFLMLFRRAVVLPKARATKD